MNFLQCIADMREIKTCLLYEMNMWHFDYYVHVFKVRARFIIIFSDDLTVCVGNERALRAVRHAPPKQAQSRLSWASLATPQSPL